MKGRPERHWWSAYRCPSHNMDRLPEVTEGRDSNGSAGDLFSPSSVYSGTRF